MITDQKVILMSCGPITVRVQRDAAKYHGAIALSDGDGTHERPLHFVLLACHADMADDAPIEATERATKALAEAVLTRLQNDQSDVGDILESSNAAAADTGRYYSVAAGRFTQSHVRIAALGKVEATLVATNTQEVIVTPNVIRIGENAILNASFGIGFKKEAVRVKDLSIEDDQMLLVTIGAGGATIAASSRRHDAESFIDDLMSAVRVAPPIVAVMRLT